MANAARVAVPVSELVGNEGLCPKSPVGGVRDRRTLRVALVNIVPDRAFEDTHRRFCDLIRASSRDLDVELRCYRLPDVCRSHPPALLRASYQDVQCLYQDPPDALLVTGTEPVSAELTAEEFWSALEDLVRWAVTTVPSTLMSCLAAHATLRALDDVDRRSLPRKRNGVFSQAVDRSHVLGEGLSSMAAFPHSRWNEVPEPILRDHGYDVVMGTEGGEWTLAAREHAGRMLVLVQGHPEYEPTTLLREYRRDLRRYAEGSASACPQVPVGYLDAAGEEQLRAWRASVGRVPPPDWRRHFSLDAMAPHVVPSWSHDAIQFFVNWIADARDRAIAGVGVRCERG